MNSMFGAQDFDMFGGLAGQMGASNPGAIAVQNLGSTAFTPVNNMSSNSVGINGIQAAQINGAGSNLGSGLNMGQGAGGGLGFNLGTGQLILGGIQAIGNIWAAMEANKLAKEQFNFQKGVTNTNLANQITSYNTSLKDRINSRSFTEGRDQSYTDQYIADNKLVDRR